MNQTGYSVGSSPSGAAGTEDANHARRKKEYLGYLENKNEEIKEQQDARRYYHGSQWTAEQIKAFRTRKQPVVTYNRIGRKINAVVGLLERQKQDPRGFPRTPKHEEGAEVATAVLRYVCDEQDWSSKSPICGLNGAVDGLAGIEIVLTTGDMGDVEVGFDVVDPSSFFYDPRSLKMDFSDARFMGVGKWADIDATIEMFPEREDEIRNSVETGTELTSNPDSDNKWFSGEASNMRVRLVDHWYIKGGEWHWCLYTGATVLAEGKSYLVDQKGKTTCKYLMFSANIDHDGDRYGFVRNMRSSQDEINQRRSKGLHLLNSRRVIIADNQGGDIERIRREAARPDGVITYPSGSTPPLFDDSARGTELQGQIAFLEDAKSEIENYGFNPALMGQGVDKLSGRAMQIQQQAGIAELGPYLLAFRGWKIRVYRALWCAVQKHWTGERWIRVTDDENMAQFFAVNKLDMDPMTGQTAIVNALGSLDVDIILDEGPDTITMQLDAYDTLTAMAQSGTQIPPKVLIELSPLAGSTKKKITDMLDQAEQAAAQPNPLAMAGAQAELADKQASTMLKQAQARKADADAMSAGMGGESGPNEIDMARALADIRHVNATTEKTIADTEKVVVETQLKPMEMAHQQNEAERSRQERVAFKSADLSARQATQRV